MVTRPRIVRAGERECCQWSTRRQGTTRRRLWPANKTGRCKTPRTHSCSGGEEGTILHGWGASTSVRDHFNFQTTRKWTAIPRSAHTQAGGGRIIAHGQPMMAPQYNDGRKTGCSYSWDGEMLLLEVIGATQEDERPAQEDGPTQRLGTRTWALHPPTEGQRPLDTGLTHAKALGS